MKFKRNSVIALYLAVKCNKENSSQLQHETNCIKNDMKAIEEKLMLILIRLVKLIFKRNKLQSAKIPVAEM